MFARSTNQTQRPANRPAPRPMALMLVAAGVFLSIPAAALAEPGLLAGPSVETGAKATTLVERNIDGSMRRPEAPAAEEALQLLTLDQATRAKVDQILTARAAQIDEIVKKNLETLNKFKTDRQANATADGKRSDAARSNLREMMEMFKPVLEKGSLESQIAAVLPEQTKAEYTGLIAEHREVMAAERRARGTERRPGRGGPPPEAMGDDPMLFLDPMLDVEGDARPPRPEARPEGRREGRPERAQRRAGGEGNGAPGDMMRQMGDLQMEIRRSVERITGERQERMGDLTTQLGLTAEQEGQVRAIMQEARRAAQDSDDPRAARRESMRKLAEILSPEQLTKLRAMNGGRGGRGDRNDNAPRQRRDRPGRDTDQD